MLLIFDGGGRVMALLLGLVALVTTLSVVSSAAVAPTHAALQLGADNFTALLDKEPETRYAMIEFYASWCPACQHFAPTYEKLATFLKDKALGEHTLLIGRVDCAAEVRRKSPGCRAKLSGWSLVGWSNSTNCRCCSVVYVLLCNQWADAAPGARGRRE